MGNHNARFLKQAERTDWNLHRSVLYQDMGQVHLFTSEYMLAGKTCSAKQTSVVGPNSLNLNPDPGLCYKV